MLNIPSKLELIKFTVFLMEAVMGNYGVLVMVFHECFHGEIISYH